jgi:hypothetical protein
MMKFYNKEILGHSHFPSLNKEEENIKESETNNENLEYFHNLKEDAEQNIELSKAFHSLKRELEILSEKDLDKTIYKHFAGIISDSKKISNDLNNNESSLKFTALNPAFVVSNQWNTILVYIWLEKAFEEARKDFKIRQQLLSAHQNENTAESYYQIPKGSEISVVPEIEGFEINPPFQKINWLEDWHCLEFRIKHCDPEYKQNDIIGKVSFYIDPILISQVDLHINLVREGEYETIKQESFGSEFLKFRESEHQTVFRKIFVSYSHDDIKIVEKLEKAYQVIGDDYLRDIRILRSGEKWNSKLLSEIDKANVFQLCWSNASKFSQNVEQEWRYAYSLNRNCFVRPVYWEVPMPKPPEELSSIHFAYLNLNN